MNYRPLSSAKVGDRLSLGYRGGWGEFLPSEILTVTKVGANCLHTGYRKWKIRDGREWGENFSSARVELFTIEDEVQWALLREKQALLSLVPSNFDIYKIPVEVLRVVIPIIFPAGIIKERK